MVVALVATAAIACAIAGGSWWLLQRHDLPFGRPVATTPTGGRDGRLAADTLQPPTNTNAASASACTPATDAAAARRAAASAPHTSYIPLAGSWVASAPDLRIRFFGMPWWDELPGPPRSMRYAAGTVPDGAGDRVDLIRVPGGIPVATAAWQGEYDTFTHRSSAGSSGPLNPATVTDTTITARPRAQKAAGYDGYIGQFHYTANGAERIDATMWVGQVGCDRVVMVFAGVPARDGQIDQAVAQVLGTIDFNAR